jgi:hypothetical protein
MGSSGGMGISTHARIRLAAILTAGGTLLLAGCGSTFGQASQAGATSPPLSTAPSSVPSISCSDVAALRASLTNLTHISVSSTTVRQLAADLDSIRARLEALTHSVTTAFKSQENELDAALAQLAAQARATAAKPSAAQVDQLGAAVSVLKQLAPPLIAETRAECPNTAGGD